MFSLLKCITQVRAKVSEEALKIYGNEEGGCLPGFTKNDVPEKDEIEAACKRLFREFDERVTAPSSVSTT